jgi:Domain of unknown function (DUF5664)
MTLPTDSKSRKQYPLSAVLDYFPDALAEVARVIRGGQVQHGVSAWDRTKSSDHADALLRHLCDRGHKDTDGLRHSAKVAWRALALLQEELERTEGRPVSRGSLPLRREPEQLEFDFGQTDDK